MYKKVYTIKSLSEMADLGLLLGKLYAKKHVLNLSSPSNQKSTGTIIELKGPLGVGKTTLARSFIQGWCGVFGDPIPSHIPSPTFPLVQVYGSSSHEIRHWDLYRINEFNPSDELHDISFFESTGLPGLSLVEWFDRASFGFKHWDLFSLQFLKKQAEERQLDLMIQDQGIFHELSTSFGS